ncbi:MAG: AMP-binding protein [Firmicutes bacterium]|nr:AMP-binding protein [Bacillota bacterium]
MSNFQCHYVYAANLDGKVKTPWLASYGDVPFHIQYPDGSMVDMLREAAEKYPDYIAYDFMGRSVSYRRFIEDVDRLARAYAALGVKENDRVTICMPNTPQGVTSFYALNRLGAIANMIHPLSSEGEILFYLQDSQSVAVLTLDQFYPKFAAIAKKAPLPKLVVASVGDVLPPLKKVGYKLTLGRKMPTVPQNAEGVMLWRDFLAAGDAYTGPYRVQRKADDPAVILYSGGTSGATKGILLTNMNFNALSRQTVVMDTHFRPGDKILSVMPIFHGFGLGISIHTFLTNGGRCILVPRFNAQTYAGMIKKQRPNYIAGVPTLYEALLRSEEMNGADLSCLKGVFSGGDSLSIELKKKFDAFLASHNASVQVREGYGTTECVTASCLTPYHTAREGSIGVPYPDTYYKIVKPGSTEEVPYGEEGEICLTGPSLMREYVNQPQETADTLKKHADGAIWLHTGDLGVMDAEGFIYFRQRIKRMIVSSGYSIYPSHLENIIDAHPKVQMSCVIGVPDPLKMQKVKAFVMLKPGFDPSPEIKAELMDYCRGNIAKYSLPYDIEFREELPKTLVGKVAYRILEEEDAAKRAAQSAVPPEETREDLVGQPAI